MEVEEEVEAPTVNVEEERKKRAKAMKSRERVEEMGFSEVFRMERMRADSALTQALRSRWDAEATAFVFPWGHMIPSLEDVSRITGLIIYGRPVSGYTYPCYHDLAERLLELPVERRSSLVPRVPLQESLGLFDVGKVWAYLHLPALGRGDLTRPGLVPIARRWDSRRDSRNLGDQLARLQEAIDSYPYLDVVWQPYLGEGDEGQPWLVQARPYFGRVPWSSPSETDIADQAVKSDATTNDVYLQAYALKYGGKVDVAGEVASLRALLYSAVQDREAAQRQTAELRRELERVRSTGAGGASSSRAAGGSLLLLEAQLVGAVLRAEEAQRHLEERRDLRLTTEHAMDLQGERDQLQGKVQTTQSERDLLCIRAEAAEAQDAKAMKELAALWVQRSPRDQEEVTRLCAELLAQQAVARSLQQIVTDIGRSRSRSRSRASVNRVTGASIGQYLAGSSSRRRNEEEERRRQGEGSAQSGRGGGEMPPPPDR
ncbi:hypothetical protein Taro_053845 [Colocasia esculenta]|uniref:Aminotransferase-like plant mobile domain-containing protein n=1 Tax=Colocasia esculenta TaxID=4460 RepID=A0A843XPE9_COLES|nr:hypothetical protein [Colocasia esculenta]